MQIIQGTVHNRLLQSLDVDDFAALAPHLDRVELPRLTVLTTAGVPPTHAYFFESGLGSIIAKTREEIKTEVGVVGRDGMVEIGLLLDAEHAPFDTFMQIGGDGLCLPAEVLTGLIDTRPTLRKRMLRYAQSSFVQVAYAAMANATHSVEERLARWLLMSADRLESNQVPLTHEFLSLMLAVRRPSVTVALHVLEGEHWIRSTRGLVTIIDRPGMEEFAGDIYRTPAHEQERLMVREAGFDRLAA